MSQQAKLGLRGDLMTNQVQAQMKSKGRKGYLRQNGGVVKFRSEHDTKRQD
jgi:hypothetical protein